MNEKTSVREECCEKCRPEVGKTATFCAFGDRVCPCHQSVREEKILKEFDKKFPNIYYIGYEELDGKKDVNSAFSREYLKDFILESLSDQRESERERISEALKYDLFPVQVKMENPNYWKGYSDTIEKVLSIIQKK